MVVGGSAEDGNPFARVVTAGAARVLWFHLTKHLYPEHAGTVTALVPTAPLRRTDRPAVTSHINFERGANGIYFVSGWGGREGWALCLTGEEARRLWRSLDMLLHPVGW